MRRLQPFVGVHQLRFVVKVAVVSAALLLPVVTHAQSHRFNIPAQNLDSALKEFGLQADRQVLFSAEVVAGRRSNSVIGNYDPARALEILLAGKGLTYEVTASNVLLIKGEPKQGGLPSNDSPVPAGKKRTAPLAAMGLEELEEITVTAQKREENIQETPISVTAVTGAALEDQGASSLLDLGQSVPNMRTAVSAAGGASLQVSMRGTFSGDTSLSASPTVGIHLDGFYMAKTLGSNMDLEDLDRVEVLRGPQGTLFGRNTIGGALNMITRKPTDERSITVSSEVGNYDAVKERLTVNVPLIGKNGFLQSDAFGTLSLRENAVYRSHEPYVDNRSPTNVPASGGAGFNNLNRVFNMTALRWQPTKDVTVDYAFEYHRYREAPPPAQVTYIYPGSSVSGIYGPSFDLRPYLRPNRADSLGNNAVYANDLSLHRLADDGNNRMHMLTAAWELGDLGALGSVTLKSISGYRSMTVSSNLDLDGSPLHLTDFTTDGNLDTWSQELQMIGTAPRLHYVLGGYYYGEHTTDVGDQTLFGGSVETHSINTGKVEAFAPFGQVTVTPPILNDKLSITAGLRFTYEHVSLKRDYRSMTLGQPYNFNLSVGGSFGLHGTAMPGLSPMANIAYQWTDNTMTYLRVSRGFQSGTVNARAITTDSFRPLVQPENLMAYEGGVKSQWFDNRLRLNVDGFLSEYTNQVLPIITSTANSTTTNLQNVGASELWGFELEAVALPLRGVEAALNYSYLNSRYLKWMQDGVNAANQRDVPYAPDHNIMAGVTYTAPPTSAGVFSAHVDGFWVDSMVNNPVRPSYMANGVTVNLPQIAVNGNYALFNARLQFVDIPLQKGNLAISAYCHNLADRQYRQSTADLGQLGWMVTTYGDPRTFGLQLTYNFTAS